VCSVRQGFRISCALSCEDLHGLVSGAEVDLTGVEAFKFGNPICFVMPSRRLPIERTFMFKDGFY